MRVPCHRIDAQHGRVRITKIAEPGQRAHLGDLRGRALPRGRRGVSSIPVKTMGGVGLDLAIISLHYLAAQFGLAIDSLNIQISMNIPG